ncbi:hypothetical protein AB0D14_02255 [Streptomyces sp. NPDC048484]
MAQRAATSARARSGYAVPERARALPDSAPHRDSGRPSTIGEVNGEVC